MFGGRSGTDPTGPAFADTWEWDGAAWSPPLSLRAGLVAREHVAAAYDPVRQAVAIVGGFAPSSGTDQHDQWEWSGTAWAQLSASVPALGFVRVLANSGSVLTLLQSATADRAVAVLVASGPGQWTSVNPAGAVPILTAYAAAQLPGGGIVAFGGSDGTSALADTWKWDGAAWAKLTATGPSARLSAAMAFDASRGRVVLYGGQTCRRHVVGHVGVRRNGLAPDHSLTAGARGPRLDRSGLKRNVHGRSGSPARLVTKTGP